MSGLRGHLVALIRDLRVLTDNLHDGLAVNGRWGRTGVRHRNHRIHCGNMGPLAPILLSGISARLGHNRPQSRELLLVLMLKLVRARLVDD
jgi:hypothetical protein